MPTRPNILWISLEDTSPRFGCYGDTVARTPNLDRLAAQGCRWTRAFSTAGVCAPARSGIITGCYPTAIGTQHMRTTHTHPATPELSTPYEAVPPHYVKCFPEYLRAAGYYCTNNEKTDYQFAPPLTAWDECSKTAHWRHRAPGQPFFAVFNPTLTHESGMWPREGESVRTDPAALTLPPYLPDTPKTRLALARHYDNLEKADQRVGELLAQLDADGLADNTIIFIWSDHGEGLPRAKRWPYDQGIRVPLIVRAPGQLQPGSVCHDLVSSIDLGPTVLSLAGVGVPRHMHGQPFLGPQAQPPRQYIFATRDRYDESYDMIRAVRDGRFKYIRHWRTDLPYLLWIPYRNKHPILQEMWRLYAGGQLDGDRLAMFHPRPPEELYDTQADPWELRNLAADPNHAADLQRLRQALDTWRTQYGDLGELSEAQLLERAWPGRRQPVTAAPIFIPITPTHPGIDPALDGGTFPGPALIQLHCATQGASIAYTTTTETGETTDPADPADTPHWHLYTAPIKLPPGTTTLRTRAIRIGFAESPTRTATFTIT